MRQLIVAAALVAACISFAKEPARRSVVKSPGKPRASVGVSTDLPEGPIPAEMDRETRITVQSESICDELATTVNGADGVQVTGGETKQHGPVGAKDVRERSVFVRVPAGVNGLVVVQVSCRNGELTRGRVQSFAVGAKDVTGEVAKPRVVRLGEAKQDADGRPLSVLRSTPRE